MKKKNSSNRYLDGGEDENIVFLKCNQDTTFMVSPQHIRFTHNTICTKFRDGHTLQDTLSLLKSHKLSPAQLPPILVYWHDNKLWSLNNRRLWVFKELEADQGPLLIPINVTHDRSRFKRSSTSDTQGRSVEVLSPSQYALSLRK